MTILKFQKYDVVQDIMNCLKDETDEVTEALVIGKKKSGARFSYMTLTENIPELIGYLEAIKTDLTLEMIAMSEKSDD